MRLRSALVPSLLAAIGALGAGCGKAPSEPSLRSSSHPLGAPCQNDAGCFGNTCCAGFCADTTQDPANCGACGNTCAAGAVCSFGTCLCPSLQTVCGGKCIDPTSDPNNCGSCGNQCVGNQVCLAPGSCGCTGTMTLCGSTCIDPASDVTNCGDCGVKCGTGQVCNAGACGPPNCPNGSCGSCNDIKLAAGNAPDGVYTIDPDGPGGNPPFNAYCDMTTAGGGWTMVARSYPRTPSGTGCWGGDGGAPGFGWMYSTGSIADDTIPYSMNVGAAKLDFTQILLGDYATGKTWGANVYIQTVGHNFVTTYASTHKAFGPPQSVRSNCGNNPLGYMFLYAGFTSSDNYFHFRDVDGPGFGLTRSGWYTCYWNWCYAGNIDGYQGMLFVR